MAEEIFRQATFTGGEITPNADARDDLKAYHASLAGAQNLIARPEGPIVRRPGLAFVHVLRNPLVEVEVLEAMVTAPNGGTVANLLEGGMALVTTTTPLGATDPFVVVEVDFGSAVVVSAVDLIDYLVVAAGSTEADPPPDPPSPGGNDGGLTGGGPIGPPPGGGAHLP